MRTNSVEPTPSGPRPHSFEMPLSGRGKTPHPGLRPGQVFETVVGGSGQDLYLELGAARVPLKAGTPLASGQAVHVEVFEAGVQGKTGDIQLRVALQDPGSRGAVPSSGLDALVTRVLTALGEIRAVGSAQYLLPAQLPGTAEAVQQLLMLFLNRGAVGQDLQALAALLGQAVADGAIPGELSQALGAMLAHFEAIESKAFKALLRRVGGSGRVEARIAAALGSGRLDEVLEEARAELRAELGRLRRNDALLRYLRATGRMQAFDEAAQRILTRITAVELQNLHRLDVPYLFIELPLPPNGEIRHAQIHFFSDGHAGGRRFDKNNATVVLDLSMTRLGDLWITLRIVEGRCQCTFRANRDVALKAIAKASDELAAALKEAGYPHTSVQVVGWDGDRLREAANLMRGFAGLELKA